MYFLLTVILLCVCYTGDYILSLSSKELTRAFIDNFTHFLAALLSWLIVLLKFHNKSAILINSLFELSFCGFLASVIDVDHFLHAKTLKLKEAMNLGKKRPLFHCTTLPVIALLLCLGLGWTIKSPKIWRFGWLTWVAIFSHHLRDSSRRGLWFWPFGSTPPVPYYLYLSLTLALPYAVMIPLRYCNSISESVTLPANYFTV